jgi:hypothetical protein
MRWYIEQKIHECPVYQISKTEKVQYPGLLDPLPIPTAKWLAISMDSVSGLPKSKGKDVILVVLDRLTKYAHFIALSHPYTVVEVFMSNIIKLHGPPSVITTDRDAIFTSMLWEELFHSMKISLHFSIAYHPEIDGQTERVNQCLEQYLRCMAFSEPKNGQTGCLQLSGGTIAVTIRPSKCLHSKICMNTYPLLGRITTPRNSFC